VRNNPAWPAAKVDFQNIIDLQPDLLTIEFVNDAGLDEAGCREGLLGHHEAPGPHRHRTYPDHPPFTSMQMMKIDSLKAPDPRPYVKGLREFADRHHVALADASSRWAPSPQGRTPLRDPPAQRHQSPR
jgi:hypothetical protein